MTEDDLAKDYANMMFRLSGKEGSEFCELKVTAFKDYQCNQDHKRDIDFYVMVVGFEDNNASRRTFGHRKLGYWKNKTKVITKRIIKEKVIRKIVYRHKRPKTLFGKFMARIGYFK